MNRKENMSAWEWFGTILRQLVNAGVEVVQRGLPLRLPLQLLLGLLQDLPLLREE